MIKFIGCVTIYCGLAGIALRLSIEVLISLNLNVRVQPLLYQFVFQ